MPFETSYHLRGAIDYVANRSHLGTLLINPIWMSVMLVVVILLTLMISDWDGSLSFKLVFYLLAGVTGTILTHDSLVERHRSEADELNSGDQIVNAVNELSRGPGELAPREPEDRPEYMVADQASAYVQPLTIDQLDAAVSD